MGLARVMSGLLLGIHCLLFLAPEATAQQAERAVPLTVQTVPRLAGIRFLVDGRSFVSDNHGLALITVGKAGTHELVADPGQLESNVRVAFEGWSDGVSSARRDITTESFTFLQAGFSSRYLWSPSFVDSQGVQLDKGRVDSVTVVDDLDNRFRLEAEEPWWLQGTRVTTSDPPLSAERILYRVDEVEIDGTTVEASTEEPFFPGSKEATVLVGPSFPSLHILVRDALFGSPMSGSVLIRYPGGQVERHPLDRQGALELKSLSRGDYAVTTDAEGLSKTRSFLVYRRQELQLQVVSYVDIAAAAVVIAAVAAGAMVLRRMF